ncbi:MAG: PspC domain-containing protein [Firmicutes bacterium]|nr:PspC domain-containing protein [Bacillota bacterium]
MSRGRLYRSTQERMIAGVAGGLAEYFGIDVVIVRLLWVLAFFFGGGIFAYLLAWIVIPEQKFTSSPEEEKADTMPTHTPPDRDVQENRWRIGGFILIFVGLIFLLRELIPFSFHRFTLPLLLMILGGVLLMRGLRREEDREATDD